MALNGTTQIGDRVPETSAPVADKDRAETFAESDVTLSHTNTEVSARSISLATRVVSNFEDQDLAHESDVWSLASTNGSPTVQSATALEGSYSLELPASGNLQTASYQRAEPTRREASFRVSADAQSGSTFDEHNVHFYSGGVGGSRIGTVYFQQDGAVQIKAGSQTSISSWTTGTVYTVTVRFDFAAQTLEVDYNGSTHGPFDFANQASDWDTYTLRAAGDADGSTFNAYYDTAGPSTLPTSGTAYVEWPDPPDVYAWDTATFQRTLNNEGVDVFIEEDQSGTWTEIAGPIQRGDSIPADPSNNIRFRVEFSRADTSNEPMLDAIYRRWKL